MQTVTKSNVDQFAVSLLFYRYDYNSVNREILSEDNLVYFSEGRGCGICLEFNLYYLLTSGPDCLKQTTSLVNVSLKYTPIFLSKKCEKLLQWKGFSYFSTKISVYLVIKF